MCEMEIGNLESFSHSCCKLILSYWTQDLLLRGWVNWDPKTFRSELRLWHLLYWPDTSLCSWLFCTILLPAISGFIYDTVLTIKNLTDSMQRLSMVKWCLTVKLFWCNSSFVTAVLLWNMEWDWKLRKAVSCSDIVNIRYLLCAERVLISEAARLAPF